MEGCNEHLKQQAEMQSGGQGSGGRVRSGGIDESADSDGFSDGVPVTGDIAGFGGVTIEKDY